MHSIINEKAKAARERSAMFGRAISGGSASSAGANPLGLGVGGSNFGFGNKRADLTQHIEQYRHNSGWVAASIKPIASRIARQPIRLARISKAVPGKAIGPAGTKAVSASGSVSFPKPWERGGSEGTASAVWFKQHFPGVYKQLAASAELIDSHPVLDAIDDPNPIMVRWSLMFVTVASLLLTGKSYWWVKARERDGDTPTEQPRIEIWPVPASWVKPVHTEERLYASWEVTPEGTHEAFPVPAEQIIYFYLPDPSSLLGAQSPLQNQARAVVSDEAIAEAQRRGFANGVFPGVAVVVGRQTGIDGKPGDRPTLNREQRAQIITAFKQAYRGVYNADEPIILDQLIQDVRRVTNTNREMDFQASGDYTKERITQGFGVNPIVMGQVEGANRASSATADDHLCQLTVNPIIELISQTLTAWLNPLLAGPGEKLCLFIEEARAADPDSDRADWVALYDRGGCSRNEMRAGLRSLAPMVDGDTASVDGNKVLIDARLASEASTPNPPRSLQPPVASVVKPTLGEGTGTPPVLAPAPAQTSEPGKSAKYTVELLDMLADMGRRRFAVATAQAVVWSIIFGIPAHKVTRILDVCSSGGFVVEPDATRIADVVRILRETETDDNPASNPADTQSELEIPVEDIRQKQPFDCGAAMGYAAALALGCEPGSYSDFMIALDTEEEIGTDPEDVFAYFAHRGCDPRAKPNRSIEYLRSELRKGRLCMCPVQYFGDGDVSGAEGGGNVSGHWVLVHGFTRDGLKVLDPIDGKLEIGNNEFLGNWYDRAQDGRPFVRYCLSAGRKPEATIDPATNTGNIKPSPSSTV